MPGSFAVTGEGVPGGIAAMLLPRAEIAAANLGLTDLLSELRICVDDLPGDDDAWYAMDVVDGTEPAAPPAKKLTLYCHIDSFGPPRPATDTVLPPRNVWERAEGPFHEAELETTDFLAARADIFLHHHLLTARDLVGGDLVPFDLPAGLGESFTALWAVAVDGRLAREGLPGYPTAERRGRFSRLFASAGVLLPEHWQAFQSLWDGALRTQREVLDLARQLPRL